MHLPQYITLPSMLMFTSCSYQCGGYCSTAPSMLTLAWRVLLYLFVNMQMVTCNITSFHRLSIYVFLAFLNWEFLRSWENWKAATNQAEWFYISVTVNCINQGNIVRRFINSPTIPPVSTTMQSRSFHFQIFPNLANIMLVRLLLLFACQKLLELWQGENLLCQHNTVPQERALFYYAFKTLTSVPASCSELFIVSECLMFCFEKVEVGFSDIRNNRYPQENMQCATGEISGLLVGEFRGSLSPFVPL